MNKTLLQEKLNKINSRLQWMNDAAENGPENLYQDGERSHADVQAEFRDLYREKNHIENRLKA